MCNFCAFSRFLYFSVSFYPIWIKNLSKFRENVGLHAYRLVLVLNQSWTGLFQSFSKNWEDWDCWSAWTSYSPVQFLVPFRSYEPDLEALFLSCKLIKHDHGMQNFSSNLVFDDLQYTLQQWLDIGLDLFHCWLFMRRDDCWNDWATPEVWDTWSTLWFLIDASNPISNQSTNQQSLHILLLLSIAIWAVMALGSCKNRSKKPSSTFFLKKPDTDNPVNTLYLPTCYCHQ